MDISISLIIQTYWGILGLKYAVNLRSLAKRGQRGKLGSSKLEKFPMKKKRRLRW